MGLFCALDGIRTRCRYERSEFGKASCAENSNLLTCQQQEFINCKLFSFICTITTMTYFEWVLFTMHPNYTHKCVIRPPILNFDIEFLILSLLDTLRIEKVSSEIEDLANSALFDRRSFMVRHAYDTTCETFQEWCREKKCKCRTVASSFYCGSITHKMCVLHHQQWQQINIRIMFLSKW